MSVEELEAILAVFVVITWGIVGAVEWWRWRARRDNDVRFDYKNATKYRARFEQVYFKGEEDSPFDTEVVWPDVQPRWSGSRYFGPTVAVTPLDLPLFVRDRAVAKGIIYVISASMVADGLTHTARVHQWRQA